MGAKNYLGVRRILKRGKSRLLIDFWFTNKAGARERHRQLASVQVYASAVAEAARLKRHAAENGCVYKEAPPPSPTYAEFVEGDFTKKFMPFFRPNTVERYQALQRQWLMRFFRTKRMNEIGTSEIRAFAVEIEKAGIQFKGPGNLLRTVLRAAHECGLIESVPFFPKGLIKVSKKLGIGPSEDDVEAMLKHVTDWLHIAIALAAFAGLRQQEVRELRPHDIDFENNVILVQRALSGHKVVPTKGDRDRVVVMTPPLADILRAAIVGNGNDRIIRTRTGNTPTRQSVLTRTKSLERRLGLRECSYHSLRHFFCTTLIKRGASVEAVRKLAGHTSLSVLDRYVHASGRDLRDAIALFVRAA